VRARVLHRAAEVLGGKCALRERLRVPMRQLDAWMAEADHLPTQVFLTAVDIINDPPELGPRRSAPDSTPLADFLRAQFSDVGDMFDLALKAATCETGAARGNVQLAHSDGMRIAAQIGFDKRFLDFFSVVRHDTPSSCGRAHGLAKSVVVEDVLNDPIFAGTRACAVMAEAGALAVQSTPLLGTSGEVIGMLSTHYDKPHRPTARELGVIEMIARRASRELRASRA
jgi:hypothetical protein